MAELEYTEGSEPAIRRAVAGHNKIEGWSCPFCGSPDVLLSDGDIAADTERVEIYCDNSDCDAREIVLLIRRGDPKPSARADVLALEIIDEGTDAEQEADGYTLTRDASGNVVSRTMSMGDWQKANAHPDRAGRKHVVARRTRAVEVTVTPVTEDDRRDPYGE